MKTAQILIALLAALLFVAGCTHAGPFVTDIAFDGQGNLLITKQTIVLDPFFGTIQNENEQTTVIKTPFTKE